MEPVDILICILRCLGRVSGTGDLGPQGDPTLHAALEDIFANGGSASPASFGTANAARVEEFFNFDAEAYPDDIAERLRQCINQCAGVTVSQNYGFSATVGDIFNLVTS